MPQVNTRQAPKPLAVDVRTAAGMIGTTASTIYRMAERGDVTLTRIPGTRRTVVLVSELERILGVNTGALSA